MKIHDIVNRGLSPFGFALVKTGLITELNRAIDTLESDKLALSNRLIEMDRLNATPRCDAPWRNYIETLEKALRLRPGKRRKS